MTGGLIHLATSSVPARWPEPNAGWPGMRAKHIWLLIFGSFVSRQKNVMFKTHVQERVRDARGFPTGIFHLAFSTFL